MLPEEDRLTITREYAEEMIMYAMGGRAAEELIFGKQTTGASDDIHKATQIARKMVCQWGMSEVIGPLALDNREGQEVFMGRDFVQGRNFSEKVAAEIDNEVHRIVTTGYKKAYDILAKERAILDLLAEALLIKETLLGPDMKRIIAGENVVTPEERRQWEDRLNLATKNKEETAPVEA
jgi:cell division protease FtsH